MKYYYSNGYLMSDYVALALRHLGKVGVLSSRDWSRFFCRNKHRRWQERQLSFLRKNGYIKKHTATSLHGKWILDEKGMAFLYERNWLIVHPVSANHVDHDEFIARSLCEMEQASYIQSWRGLTTAKKQKIIVSLIDRIEVFPDRLEIHFAVGREKIKRELVLANSLPINFMVECSTNLTNGGSDRT